MSPAGGSHVVAVVEYDGTEYLGFQIQRTGRTVQGELERAVAQLTQRPTRVTGAGRTDTGVHAKGQVVHFAALWRHPLPDLQRALNAVLAGDVAITDLREAPKGFHARFSARSREYVYTIRNSAVRSPLTARYAYHHGVPLDAEAMDRASACLVGEKDFLPFGWAPRGEKREPGTLGGDAVTSPGGRGTVRAVHRAQCRRQSDLVYVEIEADAFLRRMVRRVVGNLLLVGSGDLTIDEFAALLQLKDRRTPGVAAPAHGLCLLKVNY